MEVTQLYCITPKEIISESFPIKQGQKLYNLKIEIENQNISLNLSEENELFEEYQIELNFEELKQLHKSFSMLDSCQEYLEYMKALIQNNKISIKKEIENYISIEMIVEYLYKQSTIKIDLKPSKINLNLVVKNMYKQLLTVKEKLQNIENNNIELKEEIKLLKEVNNNIIEQNKKLQEKNIKYSEDIYALKQEINEIKKIINKSNIETNYKINEKVFINSSIMNEGEFLLNSSIMKEGEFDMIKKEIEKKMNMKIKEVNKLYQATVDGEELTNFHKKCDNIKNTLILYESKGNRRFGAFSSQIWKSNEFLEEKPDKNCFLFSLDKKKIFSVNNDNYYKIVYFKGHGPAFSHNGSFCIDIYRDKFNRNLLRTNENAHKYIFNGEKNILSEDGNLKGISCKEYEVFHVIFN